MISLSLSGCGGEPVLSGTVTPTVASISAGPTAPALRPTARPVVTVEHLPTATAAVLTPEENLAGLTPAPLPTIDPTMISRLPRFNNQPILPIFNPVSTITLPQAARRANYGTDDRPKVGIQAGHWLAENHPDELAEYRKNTGAQAAGLREADLNLDMARQVATLLEAQGVEAEVLPATPPANYQADLFLALHADGDTTGRNHGFKLARSRYSLLPATDDRLVADLNRTYAAATGLPRDDAHISANMLGYFAFDNRRYQHAINPLTPAAILEMGYVTNEGDRKFFAEHRAEMAQGIVNGILDFLRERPALLDRENPVGWQVLEATADHTPVYLHIGGPVLAYLTKGQRFEWFDDKEPAFYLVDVPLVGRSVYLPRTTFRTDTLSLKFP